MNGPSRGYLVVASFTVAALLFAVGWLSGEPPKRALFRDAAVETGLNFHHFIGATGKFYLPEIMGAGLALFDYDGDGDLDIFVPQGGMLDAGSSPDQSSFPPLPGWKPGYKLFRNDLVPTGKLHFTDVTEQAGVGGLGYGMGVAVGDYNNDGRPDLYVTNFGHNVLYRNNGNGTFTDVTREAGVDDERWSTGACFLDYDKDGLLDLYVANYLDFSVRNNKECRDSAGQLDYCRPAAYHGLTGRLFHNVGDGKFADVTEATGLGSVAAPGLGVRCADFNDDGWPDIFVANDGAQNLLWLNKKNGTFEESALPAGLGYADDGVARAGMGIAMGDINGSGRPSILVTNLTREGSTLFLSDAVGEFHDASREFGVYRNTFPFTGFGTGFFDYDNDGRLDLFVANGAVNIVDALRGTPYPYAQTSQLFHNENNRTFRNLSSEAGPAFTLPAVSRGAAFGDIDNDGDVDIVVSNNNGPLRLLLNQSRSKLHWLEIRLQSSRPNRDAIGAKVTVLRSGQTTLQRTVHADGSYLSASDVRLHFGLGDRPDVSSVVVDWPDGSHERWQGIQADHLLTLVESTGTRIIR